ncbi:MAG: hypothetical protein AB7U43_10850 [Desulfobacter sp.]
MNYAQSTANAASIVSAVAKYRTPENREKVAALEHDVSSKLNSIRKPYVSLAYGGGAATILAIIGLIVNRGKRMSNHGLESTGAPPAAGTPETHP